MAAHSLLSDQIYPLQTNTLQLIKTWTQFHKWFSVCGAKLGMWHNGISIFPWNQTWQSMKGNATLHIPSSQRTRMPPTTPEHSPITAMFCMCFDTQSHIRQHKRGVAVTQVKPYTFCTAVFLLLFLVSALFVLISFRVQPPGGQVKVYPRTKHHFPHTLPRGGTQDAWGKGKTKQLTQHCCHHHLYCYW